MDNMTEKDIPPVKKDTGLQCLIMIALFHQLGADQQQIKHQFGQDDQHSDSIPPQIISPEELQKIEVSCALESIIIILCIPQMYKIQIRNTDNIDPSISLGN